MNRGRHFTIVPVATTSWTIVVEGERNALGLLKQDVLRLSFVGNKGIIMAHCTHHLAAIDGTQTLAGLESTLAAWVAAQCDRPLGQELSPDDETRFAKEAGEWDASCKFNVFSPALWKNVAKDIADNRWVLTRKEVEGGRTVQARLVDRGFQDPDLAAGLVDTIPPSPGDPSIFSSPGDLVERP